MPTDARPCLSRPGGLGSPTGRVASPVVQKQSVRGCTSVSRKTTEHFSTTAAPRATSAPGPVPSSAQTAGSVPRRKASCQHVFGCVATEEVSAERALRLCPNRQAPLKRKRTATAAHAEHLASMAAAGEGTRSAARRSRSGNGAHRLVLRMPPRAVWNHTRQSAACDPPVVAQCEGVCRWRTKRDRFGEARYSECSSNASFVIPAQPGWASTR